MPRNGNLIGVSGSHDREIRYRSERPQLLDGLMGWTILAERNGVVRPHEDARYVHECGKSNRRTHVVAEDEEGPAVRASLSMQLDAVENRTHRVFSNAEVQNPPVRIA